jgi:hypothetical protein
MTISLMPIDVGFDLRVTRQPITLPDDEELIVVVPDDDGSRLMLAGSPVDVADDLKLRGFVVADLPTSEAPAHA